jgi:hypothetical protein
MFGEERLDRNAFEFAQAKGIDQAIPVYSP